MTALRPRPMPWWGAGMDFVAGLVVLVLMWFVVGRSALAYTTFMGYTPPPPTPGEIAVYWVLVGAVFAVQIFGYVVAIRQGRLPAIAVYPFVLIITALVVVAIAIPRIDWNARVEHPVNPGYCSRTDSENCPGG